MKPAFVLLLLAGCATMETRSIRRERMVERIRLLAVDEFRGRRMGTPEGERAGRTVAAWMQEAGLEPLAAGGFRIPFDGGRGSNVAGVLRAPGNPLASEYVVVCAHHDGIGESRSGIRNGADDNASGVALMIELAHAAAADRGRLRRSLLFVSFDGEEQGLVGSRFFVRDGPVAAERFSALICLDLVGGEFYPGDSESLYALGAESSPELLGLIRSLGANRDLPGVHPLGIYTLEPPVFGVRMARSDYGSFRAAGIPFVFFSTGTPWYYHTTEDDLERIRPAKLEANARFIHEVLMEISRLEATPSFVRKPSPPESDPSTLAYHLRRMLKSGMKMEDADRAFIEGLADDLEEHPEGTPVLPKLKRKIERGVTRVFLIIQKSGS